MTFLLDTANLATIEKYRKVLPIEGVTTNPSILKKEGKVEVFEHFRAIRNLIGPDKSLHIQVVSTDVETMLAEAHHILAEVDDKVFIKVPVTEAGLTVIQQLKAEGIDVTATAIYSKMQAFLAIAAGVDYVAPYYNRMENLNSDAKETIAAIADFIKRTGSSCKILGASYKNIAQVNQALEAGAQTVTVDPTILATALTSPTVHQAVTDFKTDWESIYGEGNHL